LLLDPNLIFLLYFQFIADHIESEPIFLSDVTSRVLIMEAMKYHLLPERRATLASPRTTPRKSTVGQLCAIGGIDASKGKCLKGVYSNIFINITLHFYKGSNSIERYDLLTNSWSHVANLSGHRLQFGVALLDGKIVVVGGRDGLKTMNIVESFDFNTKSWNSLPSMTTPRHGLGIIYFKVILT